MLDAHLALVVSGGLDVADLEVGDPRIQLCPGSELLILRVLEFYGRLLSAAQADECDGAHPSAIELTKRQTNKPGRRHRADDVGRPHHQAMADDRSDSVHKHGDEKQSVVTDMRQVGRDDQDKYHCEGDFPDHRVKTGVSFAQLLEELKRHQHSVQRLALLLFLQLNTPFKELRCVRQTSRGR